ncbi:MAG: hypothetical protein KAI18_00730 [Candidatus Aenigmarchaeota archaeon]|nr:hypothetical protein [Candidatus Aenigmarchaeota archaeon]
MSEIKIEKRNRKDKRYSLHNKGILMRQPADKTSWDKWDGLWKPPVKFIDSYSISVNGVALDEKNMDKLVIRPWAGIHTFKITGLDVSELCFAPDKEMGFVSVLKIINRSSESKEISVSLETRIDMRHDFESVHGRKYRCEFDSIRNANLVDSVDKDWKLCYGVGKARGLITRQTGKEHYVKRGNRETYIPKNIQVTAEIHPGAEITIPFVFCADEGAEDDAKACFDKISLGWGRLYTEKERKFDTLKMVPNNVGKHIGLMTPDENINKAFSFALADIEYHPKHPSTDEIDIKRLLWNVFGLVELGDFKKAKEILSDVLALSDEMIPSKIVADNMLVFDSEDVNPLFLIVLDKYARVSGDLDFEKGLRDRIIAIIRKLKLKDGLVRPVAKVSVLDPDYYDDTRIELQSLWIEALRIYHPSKCRIMSEALDVYFWDNRSKFLKDSLRDDAGKSANVLMPIFFDLIREIKRDTVLKKIRQEFVSAHGVRTRGIFDPDFKAGTAHSGGARSFATGIAACSYLKSPDTATGLKLIQILSRQMFNYELGVFEKSINSADGTPLSDLNSYGTSSLFVHAVDSGIFGIKADLHLDELTIAPKFILGWAEYERFGKRIGDHVMHVKIDRSHEKFVDIIVNFDARPGLKVKILLPDDVERMEINKVKYEGNCVTIHPGKNNRIWAYYKKG